jgi:Zn-dependent protease with chaperone function
VSLVPFVIHGLTLSLVWFFAINAIVTILVSRAAGYLTRQNHVGAPAFWLALRLLPATASCAFVAVFFIPSYWRYEPRELVEGFDATRAVVALAGLVLCALGVVRGTLAWARAGARVRRWLRVAQPIVLADTIVPAYRLDVDQPMMALVGIFRPRLFVTRGTLDALTDDELRAGVAHEIGHRRAADNLKRLAMRAAPDLLSALPAARAIERRWAAASEHLADGRASDGVDAADKRRVRCALASALVKIARLTPSCRAPLGEPISTLVDGGDIAARVHRLLDDTPADPRRWPAWAFAATLAGGTAALTSYAPALRAVHLVTEVIVDRF